MHPSYLCARWPASLWPRCQPQLLTEHVDSGDLTEQHVERIGKQILRDYALPRSHN